MDTHTPVPRLAVKYGSWEQLLQEYTARLSKGIVIAPGGDRMGVGDPCEVVLLHPGTGHMLPLRVRVTSLNLMPRVVCQFEEFNPDVDRAIRDFVNLQSSDTRQQQAPPQAEPPTSEEGLGRVDTVAEGEVDPQLIRTGIPANVHERLRRLPHHEIYRIARSGQLAERVALERIYGKTVWEALLQNPNLTPPEVARISRMGTLPKPLIDSIVSRAGWLTKPLIRRALLSNPRLDGRALTKVLRALPKKELVIVTQQTAYPYKVREAAKRLLGR